jgi:hypothetical protein
MLTRKDLEDRIKFYEQSVANKLTEYNMVQGCLSEAKALIEFMDAQEKKLREAALEVAKKGEEEAAAKKLQGKPTGKAKAKAKPKALPGVEVENSLAVLD